MKMTATKYDDIHNAAPHQRRRKLLIGISKIVESLPRKLSFAQAATATATAATRGLFSRFIFCRQTRDAKDYFRPSCWKHIVHSVFGLCLAGWLWLICWILSIFGKRHTTTGDFISSRINSNASQQIQKSKNTHTRVDTRSLRSWVERKDW